VVQHPSYGPELSSAKDDQLIPHSYNGCKQHGPNEHFLIAPAREGVAAFTGIWWDLGDNVTPAL